MIDGAHINVGSLAISCYTAELGRAVSGRWQRRRSTDKR
jgi:hypothetical protein